MAATPVLTSAGEAMARRLAGEVARLTDRGKTETSQQKETEFGRLLLETWKNAGIELPMPEKQILQLQKGCRRLSTKPEVELPENMRFTGFLQYSNVDGKILLPYGFYTFSQKDGLNRKLYKNLQSCINGGGAYVGNRLYGSSALALPIGDKPDYTWNCYEWDTDTWQLITEPASNKLDIICAAADYDPVSKHVYGITYGEISRTMLSIVDYNNHIIEEVGDLGPSCASIAAFAIHPNGTGYVLDQNSDFFEVDLSSAKSKKIGTLDFDFYPALQSMTFDPYTGKLYLVASEGDPDNGEMYGRLCEVSLNDASTKLVGYLPESEEYTVLHVVYDPEAGAPGAIEDLTATYADSSLQGTVSFTVPETTFGGNTLSGNVDYALYINESDAPAITGKAMAGEKVNLEVTATKGRTKYVVVLSNDAGEGERNAIESWGGEDIPATIKASAISDDDGNVTIYWEAGGANGGHADLEGITYSLYRFPGSKLIAEGIIGNTFTDNISEEPNGSFVYNIVPVREGLYFEGKKTDQIYGGKARTLPFSQDFESSEAEYEFYLENNKDSGWHFAPNWSVEGVMRYESSTYTDANSWALSPELYFEEGYTYVIDFRASRISNKNTEILSIGIGESYDTSEYQTILDRHLVEAIGFYGTDQIHLVYECKKTGAYHVGFHALSPRNQSSLNIHDVSVKQGLSIKVPSAVSDLLATPGANGDLISTITFTTPSTTVGNADIDKITKVTLYREGTAEPIAQLTDVMPGKQYSIIDEDAMNGKLTYTVTAWNEFGEGEAVSTSVYIGLDVPKAPYDLNVTDNLDGTITIDWKEDTIGINGGMLDLDEITYNLYYYNDGSLIKLASDIEGTSFRITNLKSNGSQAFMFLFVSAVNDLGESEATEAPVVTIGNPYTVPFMEGFKNLVGIWRPEGETISWGIYSGMSSDGDDYLIGATSYDEKAMGALRSGKITLTGVTNPKAVFSFYGIPGIDNVLSLSVSRNGGNAERILRIPFMSLDGPEGWRTCMVDLDKFTDASYINLLFEVEINDEDFDFIYIDDINVRDVPDHNLEVNVYPQNRVTACEEARIDVVVHNVGTSIESTYKVEVFIDDSLVTTLDGVTLEPFERTNLVYKYPISPLTHENCIVRTTLIDSADSIVEDNTSEALIKVSAPLLESPSNLIVNYNDGINYLEWDAPAETPTVTDNFEGYESFTYDGFGAWKVIDGDGLKTLSVISNYYPGTGNAASFFTVDFSSLGYDVTVNKDFAGHSGESFIACILPTSFENDDWAISPELSGNAQTISLFAKSLGAIVNDSFEILYSEGGIEPDDFTKIGVICEPDGSWQEFTADLPEGARYFAIHCNSLYGGMLMIDDVTYQPSLHKLAGYNVYRDNELVATVDAATTSYSETAEHGQISYKVTALYKEGESAPCEKTSGLSVSNVSKNKFSIMAERGYIKITNANGLNVRILTVDGKLIFNGVANDNVSIPASKGIYIVTVGEYTSKILID